MKTITQNEIMKILNRCIDNTLNRIRKDKTFRPFHEALLTKYLVLASSFERSFSTSFGQGPIEEISLPIAQECGFECMRQKVTMANVFKGAADEIDRILELMRAGETKPNWTQELKKVMAVNKGDTVIKRLLSDLWLKKEGKEVFISIKTVKPNLDQTEITKKIMLLLKAHDNEYETYFGLYLNF